MTMTELAKRYANRVGAAPSYLEQLIVLTKRLEWQAEEMTPEIIDAYLTESLRHLAASTVDNHRRMLRSLLRFAAEEGVVGKSIPRPLRRVKRNSPSPRAWSHAEIIQLLEACKGLPGRTLKCPLATLMPAWILTAYSTGLRLNDLLALRYDDIRGNRICVRQQKTGEPHVVFLDDNAMFAIRELPKCGPRIFGDLVGRSRILVAMRKLVKRAGLNGSTKYLRRSGATYCEVHGIDASHHLGHKSPGMKRFYVDRLLLAEERPPQPVVPPIPLRAG
jgi:integrase